MRKRGTTSLKEGFAGVDVSLQPKQRPKIATMTEPDPKSVQDMTAVVSDSTAMNKDACMYMLARLQYDRWLTLSIFSYLTQPTVRIAGVQKITVETFCDAQCSCISHYGDGAL